MPLHRTTSASRPGHLEMADAKGYALVCYTGTPSSCALTRSDGSGFRPDRGRPMNTSSGGCRRRKGNGCTRNLGLVNPAFRSRTRSDARALGIARSGLFGSAEAEIFRFWMIRRGRREGFRPDVGGGGGTAGE